MSFIGGYFRTAGKMEETLVSEKTKSFSIIPGDSDRNYKTVVYENLFGHILAKYNCEAPAQVRYGQTGDYAVITLGFHNLSYDGKNDIFTQKHSISELIEKIKNSEGEFVSIVMDSHSGDIHIANDRFSNRPLYVLQLDDGIMFSSNIAFLLHFYGRSLESDPLGWLQVFSYGHTLDTRTNFRRIKRLKPASHITISRSGIAEKQYWSLRHEPGENLEPAAFADEVFETFKKSVANRVALFKRGFCSLSGGLDSRLVAGAMPIDADFYLMTFGHSSGEGESADVKVAKQLARILDHEHRIRRIAATAVSDSAETLIRLTGGLVPIHHPAKSFQAVREMQQSFGFKIGGGPGDSLAGAFVPRSIYNINPRMTERQVYKFIVQRKKHTRKVLSLLFRKEVLSEYYNKLDESMFECFSRLSGPTAAHRLTAWAMVFRQPAFTFTSPIHNHPDVTEASPHLGYEYANCMLQLPASWLYQKNFYKFMIYNCLPQLRDVVYANTGRKLSGNFEEYSISPRKRITGAVEKMIPACAVGCYGSLKSRSAKRGRTSFEYELLKSDERLLLKLNEILHSVSDLKDLFNIDNCERFIEGCRDGLIRSNCPADEGELTGSLASACLWFNYVDSVL